MEPRATPEAPRRRTEPVEFVPGPLEAFPELSPGAATSLRQPAITLVSYDDDDTAAEFATFLAWMVQSRWLPGVLNEYGVSPTSNIDRVILPGPAPARVTDDEHARHVARAGHQSSGQRCTAR